MGWELGDLLPSNFQVVTNDDIYGITYDFDPPPELTNDVTSKCFLILTEDRRIAAIHIQGQENDRFDAINLQKVLEDKYPLKNVYHDPYSGNIFYFGQGKHQIILNTNLLRSIDVNYEDTELFSLSEQQQELRKTSAKTAADKQIQESLKRKF